MTSTVFDDGMIRLVHGDAIEALRELESNSVDAIVTDPPAGIAFMDAEWDDFRRARNENDAGRDNAFGRLRRGPEYGRDLETFAAFIEECGKEFLRVLKPGCYALVWSIPKTSFATGWGLYRAGLEPRDSIAHIFHTGMPKGRANLKPAWEHWLVFRKPGPIRHLNIDSCRIELTDDESGDDREGEPTAEARYSDKGVTSLAPKPGRRIQKGVPASPRRAAQGPAYGDFSNDPGTGSGWDPYVGRYPANVVLTDGVFDEESEHVIGAGDRASGFMAAGTKRSTQSIDYGTMPEVANLVDTYADSGSQSRFYLLPKPSVSEKERGLEGFEKSVAGVRNGSGRHLTRGYDEIAPRANTHPTAKSITLMRHLVRLVAAPGELVIDPFVGSGTTMLAVSEEGMKGIGVDQSADYLNIAQGRLIATPIGMGLVA